jgi:asparagine synthase (glutamine-hydrolysing)
MPGKAAHVRAIATLLNHLEGHGRAAFAPVLFPLLSQPVVEFCLAVPSWHWCEGGRNRSLARGAYAGRLPAAVIERRSKGAFDGFCARLFERNRACVGEMLLEGMLAGQEIIDRGAAEAAVRNPAPSAELVMRLLALVDVEAWLQSWSRLRPAPAARARASGHTAPACPEPGPRVD